MIYLKRLSRLKSRDIELTVEKTENDLDGLNYLAGQTIDLLTTKPEGTLLAHTDGVPNLIVTIPKLIRTHSTILFISLKGMCDERI
jgi:hypothetical protein